MNKEEGPWQPWRQKHVQGIIRHFQNLPHPRSPINRRHFLADIMVICICGVIAGADGPVAIEQWAKAQEGWLKKYLRLPYGIPSHDTIGRVLKALHPQAFQECFAAWVDSLREGEEEAGGQPRHLAIDGKTLRRSHDRGRGLGPLHLVSVWATEEGISLGQLAAEEKSNEITATAQLLDRLELKGAVVTIDAAGCQKAMAKKIIEEGGDYVLGLKGNQGKIHEAVKNYFQEWLSNGFAGVAASHWEEQEQGHGREERRCYYQVSVPGDLAGGERVARPEDDRHGDAHQRGAG